eukprot:CAMPEP_0194578368 /NCGR_PEP_ID=MMETSP0292-20121207/12807_1 /TAXON_ID=39354 /ORGANISM="Heterosigma akashiwo, Strain CCMP2393" /LENGTH=199 /DNA_ID=CAMNT_0039430995 /DNA_START=261 /DNA_END=855 /DNA_ORIENTATION=-
MRYGPAGGRLLVLNDKSRKAPGVAGGGAAGPAPPRNSTPAPVNTASLRREHFGNDVGVALVGRGAANTSWGNKVAAEGGGKEGAEKSDASSPVPSNQGVWKDKDDDSSHHRPKIPPKPVNTKWGDDDDSPLDMEFPSLAGGARAPERADQQDQSFRPNRGGAVGDDEPWGAVPAMAAVRRPRAAAAAAAAVGGVTGGAT